MMEKRGVIEPGRTPEDPTAKDCGCKGKCRTKEGRAKDLADSTMKRLSDAVEGRTGDAKPSN